MPVGFSWRTVKDQVSRQTPWLAQILRRARQIPPSLNAILTRSRMAAGAARRTYFLSLPTIRYFTGRMTNPEWLYLEFVNTCNADCIFCAYRFDPRPKLTLAFERIKSAAREFRSNGGKNIGLSPHHGETFVDREAVTKIKHLQTEGFEWIHTYTNASLLHKFGPKEILCSGLTNLRISLPPLDEESYKRIFRNGNYRRVLSNVRDLLIAFGSTPEKTVKDLHLEFRSDRPLDECQSLPDYVENISQFISEHVHVHSMSVFDSWSGAIKQDDLLPGMVLLDGENVGPKRIPCGRMFTLQILSDGAIRQCGCRVDNFAEKDELVIGHVDNMTLKQAFNSKAARDNIASFITGNLLGVCRTCSWYNPEV
jgi:hypothetical protein